MPARFCSSALLALVVGLALTGCITEDGPADPDPPADGGVEPRDARVDPPDGLPDGATDAADAAAPPPDARPDVPPRPACANGEDDDGDGLIDLADPGCVDGEGADEADPDPLPACGNGLDEDDDGLIDYPADPDCRSAGWGSEGAVCGPERTVTALEVDAPVEVVLSRGAPVADASCGAEAGGREAIARITAPEDGILLVEARPDGDLRLFARGTCRDRNAERACRPDGIQGPLRVAVEAGEELFVFAQPTDGILPRPVELTARIEPRADHCRNGLDDDGDGRIDQADPGCAGPDDPDEADPDPLPACGNGEDDDGDGAIDWPDDPECPAAGGLSEGLPPGLVCATGDVVEVGLGVHALGFELDSADPGLSEGQCGGNGAEAMVLMRVDRPAALTARITGPAAGVFASYLRTNCEDPRTETLCDAREADRIIEVPRLGPGTYALFLDHDVGFADRVDLIAVDIVLEALPLRACENGEDDDGDGLIDADDPGCFAAIDRDEADPDQAAACADGVDNDGDGDVDHPADRTCRYAGSAAEGAGCPGDRPLIPVGLAGGRFTVDPRPFDPGFAIARCGGDRGAEAVFVLDLPTAADVRVSAGDARVFVRDACDEAITERACSDDGELELDRLDAGRYFVLVEPGERAVDVQLDVDSLIRACNDGVDNDGDGLLDVADPGCTEPLDRSEDDPDAIPACSDGLDNDGDGATDWPADPQCRAAGDPEEDLVCDPGLEVFELGPDGGRIEVPAEGDSIETICGDENRFREVAVAVTVEERSRLRVSSQGGVPLSLEARTECIEPATAIACDEARQGLILDVDPGTTWILAAAQFANSAVEVDVESLIRACNNEIDDDGDGLIDLADPGCGRGLDDDEADPPEPPACADGLDNDDDGATDWPDDPECFAAGTTSEAVACPPIDDLVVVPPEGGAFDTDTTGRANLFEANCANNARGGEQVFALILPEDTEVDITIIDADYDTALFVRQDCVDGGVAFCDDDGAGDLRSRITERLAAGTWFVFVDGFRDNSGRARVRFDLR